VTTAAAPARRQIAATPAQATYLERVCEAAAGAVAPGQVAPYRYLGYGGSVGGAKTWAVILAVAVLCKMFPGSHWTVVRKDLPTLKRTTLQSYAQVRALFGGDFLGPVNRSTWVATTANGSQILFFTESLDVDPDLDRWKGLETNGFVLEEANELAYKSFAKAIERAGRWKIMPTAERPTPTQPSPLILLTFNPSPGWVKYTFWEPWRNGALAAPFFFQRASIDDNPHLSAEYLDSLKSLPPEEYRRFVEGDWDAVSGRFFTELDARTHLIPRSALPEHLPPWWAQWMGGDWGFRHNAVYGFFAQDADGTRYLLDSVWCHRLSDREQAERIRDTARELGTEAALACAYLGGDAFNRRQAHSAQPESVADVFEAYGIYGVPAYTERVGGWRVVRQGLAHTPADGDKAAVPPSFRIVDTPNNRRVLETLLALTPDPDKPEDVEKVDADEQGRGGDDGGDMTRYGLASRAFVAAPAAPAPDWVAERRDAGALLAELQELQRDDARPYDDLPPGF
jgi:phage terminase large subunit